MLGKEKLLITFVKRATCNLSRTIHLSTYFLLPECRLDANNIFESPIKWQKNTGLDPNLSYAHSQYLTSMSERFSSTLETKIAKTADLLQAQTSSTSAVYQEVLCHGAYCKEQVKKCMVSWFYNCLRFDREVAFSSTASAKWSYSSSIYSCDPILCQDRPGISSYIHSYVDGSSNRPLVIHGPTGSGKTSIVAAAAYRLRQKNPLRKMTIVLRFLGTTPHSSDIRHTLRSICEQVSPPLYCSSRSVSTYQL